MERSFGGRFGLARAFFYERNVLQVGKDSDAGTVSQLPVPLLATASVRATRTGTGNPQNSPCPMGSRCHVSMPLRLFQCSFAQSERDEELPQCAQTSGNAPIADSDFGPAVSAQVTAENDEADEEDSELDDTDSTKKRKSRAVVKRTFIAWHTIEVIDRTVMNDEEVQARLTEIARNEYETGGIAFPPGNFQHVSVPKICSYLFLTHSDLQKQIQESRIA